MPLKVGSQDVVTVKVGSQDVVAVYIGDVQVWPTGVPIAYVANSYQAHVLSEINDDSHTVTRSTTRAEQDGTTAIIWIVASDGNSSGNPWLSQEGLTALHTINCDTFGDDIAVYIEFPSWSSSGTNITRTFNKVPGDINQAVIIASLEIEGVDPNDYLDAVGERHSSSALTADVSVTATEDDVLLLFVSASNTGGTVTTESVTDDRGFDILAHHLILSDGQTPFTCIAVKKVNAGLHASPSLTMNTSVRRTMMLAALRQAP